MNRAALALQPFANSQPLLAKLCAPAVLVLCISMTLKADGPARRYRVVDFGNMTPVGLSDTGDVAGIAFNQDGTQYTVLYDNGQFVSVNIPSMNTAPLGINRIGETFGTILRPAIRASAGVCSARGT